MSAMTFTRREISVCAGSALALVGAAGPARAQQQTEASAEITHGHAAIHDEVDFATNAASLFRALTVTEEFDKVVRLSAAMNSDMNKMLGTAPTEIDARAGGAFLLFGGYISGFTLELIPAARIVQAWRAGSWDPGSWSIVKFVLLQKGAGCRLIFDHAGFPDDDAAVLAKGWHANYWEPLAKVVT